MKKGISIIIVSFNTKEITLKCIDSIIEDKCRTDYEIIVIDNASTDSSRSVLEKLNKASIIKLIANSQNVGFAKAVNSGIRKSVFDHILILNSDIVLKKGFLDKIYNFAISKSDAGAIVPKLVNSDGSVQPSVFRFPSVQKAVEQYWLKKHKLLDKYAPKTDNAVEIEIGIMAAFLITPKALDQVGLLDEKYFMYYEDFDYCRRIKKAALKTYYYPEATAVHLHGASGKTIVSENIQWMRLVPSSKIYNGLIKHYLINEIIWSGQKISSLRK